MKRVSCPSGAFALALSLYLDAEGCPSVWAFLNGQPTVYTLAPNHLVRSLCATVTATIGEPYRA